MDRDIPMQRPDEENVHYDPESTHNSYALPTLAGPSTDPSNSPRYRHASITSTSPRESINFNPNPINRPPSNTGQIQPNSPRISRRQSGVSATGTYYTQGYNNYRAEGSQSGSDTPVPSQPALNQPQPIQPQPIPQQPIPQQPIPPQPIPPQPVSPEPVPPEPVQHKSSLWNPGKWIEWIQIHWIIVTLSLTYLFLLAACIAFIVLYTTEKKSVPSTANSLTISESAVPAVLPHADSAIGAANVIFGVDAQTKDASKIVIAFESGNRLCVRGNSNETWSETVQCLDGTNIKAGSPIAVLDWLGGPSIYYIDQKNFLSGVDYIPETQGWKLSSLASQKTQANSQSQLAAVTWLNGSSAWVYFQDSNNQLREFGIDDYRNLQWRYGAYGPLGLFLPGSGIGAARYVIEGNEYLEVYYQTSNDAIHGRLYAMEIWTSNIYSVDSTTTSLLANAGLTATTVIDSNGTMVILVAYVSNDGFLTVQSRNTLNVTDYGAFSAPMNIKQGDGSMMTGIAATGKGSPNIYFEDGQKVILLYASSVSDAASSWSSLDLST